MFKVGMGETPEIPSTLSEEGVDFVECCLFHDPKERWTATELLQHHNFLKVGIESVQSTGKINFFFSQVVLGDDCSCDGDKKAKK